MNEVEKELGLLKLASQLAQKIIIFHFYTHDAIEFQLTEATIIWKCKNKMFDDLPDIYQPIMQSILVKADHFAGNI